MSTKPQNAVRYYVYQIPPQTGENDPGKLKMRIWVGILKKRFEFTTDLTITPKQFSKFKTDGTPTKAVQDTELAKEIQWLTYSAFQVVSSAIVYGRAEELTGPILAERILAVRNRNRATYGTNQFNNVVAFIPPECVPLCNGCVYCKEGETLCACPKWFTKAERDRAAEFAAMNGICLHRETPEGWQPNPNYPPQTPPDQTPQRPGSGADSEKGGEQ